MSRPPAPGARTRRPVAVAVAVAVAVVGPLAVMLAVWLPVFRHYHVADVAIEPALVQRLRSDPADDVLDRLAGVRYDPVPAVAPDALERAAELMKGRVRLKNGDAPAIGLVPTPAALAAGTHGDQLDFASLAPADTLLAAHRLTGEAGYLDAALGSALAWARFERDARLPSGFLWNDHAIAARVLVLARLWRSCRDLPQCDPDKSAELLGFVSRSVALLARPSHYTARTNHGVMQDLALLHAAIAFPGLPGVAEGSAVARNRLALHLPYYVADNGAVLEHSTGYQDFAVHLLRTAVTYGELPGATLPAGLVERHAAAECRQRSVMRPDRSLPAYGDTWDRWRPGRVAQESADVSCPRAPASWIDEDFGYGVLGGQSPATQLFLAWANFPGRAHKHDDELAAWLWHGGRDWWAAAGYWPYGDASHASAVSWRGSNAPHGVTEPDRHGGTSRMLTAVVGGPAEFIELERRAPDGGIYRRQVATLPGAGVLVLDSAQSPSGGRFESVWTLEPDVRLQPQDAGGAFPLQVPGQPAGLLVQPLCRPSCEVGTLRGSHDPLGGLVARNGVIADADALVVSAPAGTWSAVLWRYGAAGGPGAGTAALDWQGDEQWTLSVESDGRVARLSRTGLQLLLQSADGALLPLQARPGAARLPLREAAVARYREAVERFPPFRDDLFYRYRASAGILVLALLQFAGLWVLASAGIAPAARVTLQAAGWVAVGIWLYYSYFG